MPCYQKSKRARLFVSSFPNWVKGHLNNDLDIFVGNKEYSGVQTSGTAVATVMPNYVKGGWNALYSEGAVMFTEEVEEFDWLDIFNFFVSKTNESGTGIEIKADDYNNVLNNTDDPVHPNWGGAFESDANYPLLYQKVKYNVAHYDGIYTPVRALMSNYSVQGGYHYAMLEDEAFKEAAGKRWVGRQDNVIRRFYESGQMVLPVVMSVGANESEEAASLDSILVTAGGSQAVMPEGDRIIALRYMPGAAPDTGAALVVQPKEGSETVSLKIKVSGGVLLIGPPPDPAYELPDLPNFIEGSDLGEVQSEREDVGPGISGTPEGPVRYKCSNANWDGVSVYFEVVSYHRDAFDEVVSVELVAYTM